MSDWLDLELSHHLAPVEAPEALWDRIQSGSVRRPERRRAGWVAWPITAWPIAAWPIAAILTLMAAAGTLWLVAKGEEPALDLHQLAIEQLRHWQPLELHSSDPAQISAWMRRAGLEVRLPAERNRAVRLVGARIIETRGTRVGAVEYQVGGDTAVLLVAHAGPAVDGGHGNVAWRAQGQSYALASSNQERPDEPCLLCHASL